MSLLVSILSPIYGNYHVIQYHVLLYPQMDTPAKQILLAFRVQRGVKRQEQKHCHVGQNHCNSKDLEGQVVVEKET